MLHLNLGVYVLEKNRKRPERRDKDIGFDQNSSPAFLPNYMV